MKLLVFQSTLPARGATRREVPAAPRKGISIHAPRTGSDAEFDKLVSGKYSISIHAPRTGSDKHVASEVPAHEDFNPRSPHGERHSPTMTDL